MALSLLTFFFNPLDSFQSCPTFLLTVSFFPFSSLLRFYSFLSSFFLSITFSIFLFPYFYFRETGSRRKLKAIINSLSLSALNNNAAHFMRLFSSDPFYFVVLAAKHELRQWHRVYPEWSLVGDVCSTASLFYVPHFRDCITALSLGFSP
jgi:energy-coupling factor transporter transmembrane protein EcfT